MCNTCVSLEFACYMIQLYYVATQSLNIHTPATMKFLSLNTQCTCTCIYIIQMTRSSNFRETAPGPVPHQASLTHWHIHTYMQVPMYTIITCKDGNVYTCFMMFILYFALYTMQQMTWCIKAYQCHSIDNMVGSRKRPHYHMDCPIHAPIPQF